LNIVVFGFLSNQKALIVIKNIDFEAVLVKLTSTAIAITGEKLLSTY